METTVACDTRAARQAVPIHLIRNSCPFPAHTCDSRQEALGLWKKFKVAPVVADGNVTLGSRSTQPSSGSDHWNANRVGVPSSSGLEGQAQAPAIPVEVEAVERGIPADLGPGAPVDRMRQHLRDKLGGSTSGTKKELWDRATKLDNERKKRRLSDTSSFSADATNYM